MRQVLNTMDEKTFQTFIDYHLIRVTPGTGWCGITYGRYYKKEKRWRNRNEVADMHCDTILAILRGKEQGKEISLRKNNLNVDLERMKKGDYLIQNFALFWI